MPEFMFTRGPITRETPAVLLRCTLLGASDPRILLSSLCWSKIGSKMERLFRGSGFGDLAPGASYFLNLNKITLKRIQTPLRSQFSEGVWDIWILRDVAITTHYYSATKSSLALKTLANISVVRGNGGMDANKEMKTVSIKILPILTGPQENAVVTMISRIYPSWVAQAYIL